MTNSIIQKEAEEIATRMDGRTVTSHEHYREMLQKELERAISALLAEKIKEVEEKLAEIEKIDATKQDALGHYYEKNIGEFMSEVRAILATAKTITSTNTGTLQG